MKINAVLFDVDGTLVDLDIVVKALQETMKKWNVEVLSKEEIYKKIVGTHLEKTIKKLYPHLTIKQVKEMREDYHTLYKNHTPEFLPHAKQILQTLKDKRIKIGIITTKSRTTAVQTVKDLKIPHGVLITADDVKEVKPSTEPLLKAFEKLGVSPSSAMMVGDHVFDVRAAKNAGCISVAVTTGASSAEELKAEKPDFLFSDLIKLTEIIE